MTDLSPLGDQPLVTIVTPSYNQGSFIAQTIESVLSQDYPRIEYLVVDGESTDDTLSILRSYGGRINWTSEPDRNQSEAINKGFRRAKGSIVAWVNSDDMLMPGAVSKVVRAFVADPTIGLVYGATRLIDRRGELIEDQRSRPPDIWTLINLADYVAQPSTFMRRDAVSRVGWIDESLRYCMDYELFMRLFAFAPVRHLPDSLSATRIYGDTFTASGGAKRFREVVRVARRHSGRHFPPAVAFYAVDWFELGARRVLAKFGDSRGTQILRRCSNNVARAGYQFVTALSHGTWEDGWCGRRARFLLPRAEDTLEITGTVPGRTFADRYQAFKVIIDGNHVDRIRLPPGPFRLVYSLPDGSRAARPAPVSDGAAIRQLHAVELRASRSSRPDRSQPLSNSKRDRRKLSWQLAGMRTAREEALDLPERVGWFEDGWASPSVTVFLPSTTEARIRVRGRLPEEVTPRLGVQHLTIFLGTYCIGDARIEPGDFDLRFETPFSLRGRSLPLHIEAEKWFDPSNYGSGDGPRKLSYLLSVVGSERE